MESYLAGMFNPTVQLKSGGYIVIGVTEALVAIDVNSGKATRERNIEQTATRTNLEAAEEACRQMRLRDLAGLIVIDFIDMDENKNNRAVEKKLKECLKVDRARVQHGRISQFGLMEISRQRRRQGVLQATSDPCPSCNGTGRRRSIPSAALQLIRAIEARAATGGLKSISVKAPTDVALYILNNKREALIEIERIAGFAVSIHSSEEMLPGDFTIDAERDQNAKPKKRKQPRSLQKPSKPAPSEDEDDETIEDDETSDSETESDGDDEDEKKSRRKRRRRGGRRRNKGDRETGMEVVDGDNPIVALDDDTQDDDDSDDEDGDGNEASSEDDSETPRKRRRRGRRGGRRRRRNNSDRTEGAEGQDENVPSDGGAYLDGLAASAPDMLDAEPPATLESSEPEIMPESVAEEAVAEVKANQEAEAEETPKPKRTRRSRARKSDAEDTAAEDTASESANKKPAEEPKAETADLPDPEVMPADVAAEAVDTVEAEVEAEAVVAHMDESAAAAEAEPEPAPEPAAPEPAEAEKPAAPRRTGWWSRARK